MNLLEKTTVIATCDVLQMKPPAIVTVIADFNYEASDAPAYKFNNSATSTDPKCTHLPNLRKIEQLAADLMRFEYVKFGRRAACAILDVMVSRFQPLCGLPVCTVQPQSKL